MKGIGSPEPLVITGPALPRLATGPTQRNASMMLGPYLLRKVREKRKAAADALVDADKKEAEARWLRIEAQKLIHEANWLAGEEQNKRRRRAIQNTG